MDEATTPQVEQSKEEVIYDRRSDQTPSLEDGQPSSNSPSLSTISSLLQQAPSVPSRPQHQTSVFPETYHPLPWSDLPTVLSPSLQQSILPTDELENFVDGAIKMVKNASFDKSSAITFTKEIKSIYQSSVDKSKDTERFCKLLWDRLDALFLVQNCGHVSHGLHLFYTALLLTGELVVCLDQDTNDIAKSPNHLVVENFMWTVVFDTIWSTGGSTQELLDLLELLGVMVERNYTTNPSVCYYIILIILRGYQSVRLQEHIYNEKTKHLVLIMAKCAADKGRYDLAEKGAKEAAENFFRMENADALELWSLCLRRRGDYKKAIDVAKLAIDCSQDCDKVRLQQMLEDLERENSQTQQNTSKIDTAWLKGTNILQNSLKPRKEPTKKQPKNQRKRKSKNKTKAVSKTRASLKTDSMAITPMTTRSNDESLRMTGTLQIEALQNISNSPGACQKPETRRDEDVFTEEEHPFEKENTRFKKTDQSESSESEEEIDLIVYDQEEEQNLCDSEEETQTKTWFEESQDLYKEGHEQDKLIFGEGLDIEYQPKSERLGLDPKYKPFKPIGVLQDLMKTQPNKYKRCRIELDGPHRAFCRVLDTDETHHKIEIHGRSKCGQTFDDDEVVVELADPDQNIKKDADKAFGTVVGVLNSKFSEVKYRLLACTNNPKEVNVMHPLCKSVPKLYIWNGATKKNFKNHKYRIDIYTVDNRRLKFERYFDILPNLRSQYVFLVVFLTWPPYATYPKGAVLKVLECGSKFSSCLEILENKFKVPTHYSSATVAQVEDLMKQLDKPSAVGYTDIQKDTVFTIDPPQSKDLDDALSIREEEDNFMVGVHIADVASVVKKGDAVDIEAKRRATSFYPSSKGRAYNMLPEPLSQNKLSLLPNEERLVLSVFFQIDRAGETIGEPLVKKCVIRSCRQFSYREAKLIIEGRGDEVECSQLLKENILQLHDLAQMIRTKRLKNSRFAVQFEDPRFLDVENLVEDADAHELVEEFMIKANHFIASWLTNVGAIYIPLRCQAAPPQEELNKWINDERQFTDMLIQLQDKSIQNRKIEATKHCSNRFDQPLVYLPVQKKVWKIITEATTKGDLNSLRKFLCCDEFHPLQCLTRSHWLDIMQSASYKCSADGTDQDLKHFMLDIEPYTHFTSPIRRYIDIVVHRLVHAVLDKQQSSPYTVEEVQEICMHVTEADMRQRQFARGCKSIRQAERLLKTPMMVDAIVDKVSNSGVTLCIPFLHTLSSKSREIAFNRLDFCRKPTETVADKTGFVGAWNKRFYHFEELQCRKINERENYLEERDPESEEIINSDMHVLHVQLSDFSKLLKAVFEKHIDVNKHALCLSTKEHYQTGVRRIKAECSGDSHINHHSRFKLAFSPGQILRLQMHAAADQGILSPYVQMFQVCDNLNMCLDHMKDPVNTYAEYVKSSIRGKTFETVDDYQDAWLPIVEMETALSSVSSGETVLISNVKIDLCQKVGRIMGTFSFDTRFCEVRKIEIDGKPIDKLVKMMRGESAYNGCETQRSLDYLCIRYAPQNLQEIDKIFPTCSMWIGHAIIVKVKKRVPSNSGDAGGEVIVTFQLRSNSIPPPPCLLTRDFTALVEIIFKTEVNRRTEQMLTVLQESKEDLASSIALNSPVLPIDNDQLKWCQCSPSDIQPGELNGFGYMQPNNTSQDKAIRRALEEPFSLIQGPPGTGKTYTGLKLVYLFNKINKLLRSSNPEIQQKQVLFCGPSNKSVDLVAKYLMKKLSRKCPKIVRMYGKTIENKDFPVPNRNVISNRSMRGLKSDTDLRSITLHYVIRQKGKPSAVEIEKWDARFKKYFSDKKKEDIDQEDIKEYTILIAKAEQDELEKCDVILCTCVVGGSMKLTEVSRIGQCIIDESAMCPEPQSMIPIIATKPDQVVLIGDHRQLRPIVQCTQAAELGLDQSLFERYKNKSSFLNTQYRMHPKICEFPSTKFYDGKLKTGPDRHEGAKWYIPPGRELSIWPVRTNPKVFCHVEGVEETLTVSTEEGNEQSKSNTQEIEKIVEVFHYLVRKEDIKVKDINLMTQYNAQRSAITEKLKNFSDVDSTTVVSSQGGEWDYVIFSTVRSLPIYKIEAKATPGWLKHNLGFITDQNQINVALTRARKGLIIIGNANLLECDPVWNDLLQSYKREGCYVNADRFPPRTRWMQSSLTHQVPGSRRVLSNRI